MRNNKNHIKVINVDKITNAFTKVFGKRCKRLLHLQGGPKNGATDLWAKLCQFLTDSRNFFTERFLGKFAVKRMSKIPQYRAYVATLPCKTLMSAKQAINDKLQGSVATCLKHGRVVDNRIKKGLLLSLTEFFLNRWIFGKVTSKNVIVSCTFSVVQQCVDQAHRVHETNHVLACNFAKYSLI